MGCRRTRSHIVAWLDGELGESDASRVQEHLESCPRCQAQASLLHATEPRPCPPPDDVEAEPFFAEMTDAILTRYDDLDAVGEAFHRQRWWPSELRLSALHAVAYAAVLLTALGWAWVSHLEAQEAIAAKDKLLDRLLQGTPDRTVLAEERAPIEAYEAPVLQPAPLWSTAGTHAPPAATTVTIRPASTTPYRGTF